MSEDCDIKGEPVHNSILHGQEGRVSCSIGYKGIVVGGLNSYHPEKMDISVTLTVDHLEGESKEALKERLDGLKKTEEVLIEYVGKSVVEKVNAIKKRFQEEVNKVMQN